MNGKRSKEEVMKTLEGLVARRVAANVAFADRVVTVATGFLAFSITFRSSLIGENPSLLGLLQAAWVCLGISAVAGVFIHQAASSAALAAIKRLQADEDEISAASHPAYDFLYDIICVAFPLGIICLLVFGIKNAH